MTGRCVCGYVAPVGVRPTDAAYHRGHRDHHLAAFPNVSATTREALNALVTMAERGAFVPPSSRPS